MSQLFLDFETRSTVDLRKCGADVYARHPSTRVMAIGYAFDDEPAEVIGSGAIPPKIFDHIKSGKAVIAHNFHFEWLIWNYVLAFPKIEINQSQCTMVMSYALGLPGSLEKAAKAVGLTQEKDLKGGRIMLQLSQPRSVDDKGAPTWYSPEEFPEKYDRMYQYCRQDVELTRALYRRLIPLSKRENEMWHLDHKINQRGVCVDVHAATEALKIVRLEQIRLNKNMQEVTNNAVSSTSANAQLTDWLASQGVGTEGVAKSEVTNLLAKKDLPSNCRRSLEIRQEAAKSSTAKISTILERTCSDGRLRSSLQFYGAGTGRWSGRGFQPQNLPRSKLNLAEISQIYSILVNNGEPGDKRELVSLLHGKPLDAISNALRGFLIAEKGKRLISADYANIEGRVLAWLAHEDWKVDAFRDFDNKSGPDLYRLAASRIFNCGVESVDSSQRTIGKVAELALGYQGGSNAFQKMATIYGIDIPKKKSDEIKTAWRDAHPNIVSFWYELERISIAAVQNPGRVYFTSHTGRQIKYRKVGSFLFCQLPSGRAISYPYPNIETITTPWGKEKEALTYMGMSLNQWTKQNAYGGLLAENITQAVARDILADAIKRLEKENYPVAFHVHDEIVCELPEGTGSLNQMKQIMCASELWAEGLPVVAEGWEGVRYRK